MSARRTTKRPPARRRPQARTRKKKPSLLRRALPLGVAALAGGAIVFGVSRIDFGEAIKEITLPLRYDSILRAEATDEDIARTVTEGEITLPETSPALLAAVIYTESRFADQTSSAGARGLMQITPDTADTIEKLSGGATFEYEDLADPELNIRYGSFFLRYLLHRYDGNVEAALAAYNAGTGNADAWGGSELEQDDIEFPETRAYVEEVLEKEREYEHNYGDELGL